jgi:hypothetical protein
MDCKNKANLPTKDVTNYFHGGWRECFCSCIGMGGRCCLVLPDLSEPTVEVIVRVVSAGVLCTVRRTVTGTYRFADPQACPPDRQVWRPHDAYHRVFRKARRGNRLHLRSGPETTGQGLEGTQGTHKTVTSYTDFPGRADLH